MLSHVLRGLSLVILFVFSTTVHAGGTSDCTPIDSVPIVINSPGSYCLSKDFNLSIPAGKAIFIKSDDVNLDFRHYSLNNALGRLGNTASGVYYNNRDHVKITGGTITGFGTGIHIDDVRSMGNRISSMKFYNIRGTGIDAEGTDLQVSRNSFNMIGGSTFYRDAIAIGFKGMSPRITGNAIRNLTADDDNAVGIQLNDSTNPYVADNILDTFSSPKLSYGMRYNFTKNAIILRNTFYGSDVGIGFENGSSGLTNDTFMQDVTTPTTGTGLIFIGHNF